MLEINIRVQADEDGKFNSSEMAVLAALSDARLEPGQTFVPPAESHADAPSDGFEVSGEGLRVTSGGEPALVTVRDEGTAQPAEEKAAEPTPKRKRRSSAEVKAEREAKNTPMVLEGQTDALEEVDKADAEARAEAAGWKDPEDQDDAVDPDDEDKVWTKDEVLGLARDWVNDDGKAAKVKEILDELGVERVRFLEEDQATPFMKAAKKHGLRK